MKQEIHFKGLSLTPDNHHAEIGALSLCAGAELHDGALRVSVMPHTQVSDKLPIPNSNSTFYTYAGYNATLRFVHQGNGYTHFIGTFIKTDTEHSLEFNDVYWYNEAGTGYSQFYGGHLSGIATTPTPLATDPTASVIQDIQAVGNTLIFVCTTGLYYFLWKDGTYKYLGQKPPFVKLQFSLTDYAYTGETVQALKTAASTMYDLSNQQNLTVDIKEQYRTEFTENAYALINRVNSEIAEAGAFYAPFFIRYCYRLFDGTSFVLHSPPVLMPVCIGPDNYIQVRGLVVSNWGTDQVEITVAPNQSNLLQIAPLAAKLQYKLNSSTEWAEVKDNWSDIVSSVDIFISQPITRTRQGEQFERVGKLSMGKTWELRSGIISNYSWNGSWVHAHNPELEESAYKEKLLTPDVFFKIASFKLNDELETSFADLPVQGTVLLALAAQQRMEDDYHTHHRLTADASDNAHSYVYNKRLHVFSAIETLFEGFQEDSLMPYFNPSSGGSEVNRIYVRLSTEDGDKTVCVQSSLESNLPSRFLDELPFFYPDSRAYSMIIVTGPVATPTIYELPMSKLPLLEGAVTKGEYSSDGSVPQTLSNTVPTPNKLYVSEIANPFFFPLEGRVTVGIGSIGGLATTTTALSQGQFGQYPLIAFCSDGVWALDVSAKGTYSAVHPISREVCVNAKSICQLDQSVLFATKRGLSRIVGSSVASVTDALDGPLFDVGTKLFNGSQFDQGTEILLAFATHPFTFFEEATLLYDFINSRVLAVKPGVGAAYVLSLRDGTWSTMSLATPLATATSYPYPYYQTSSGHLWHLDKGYDYSANPSDNPSDYALVVTRSMSFAATMQVIQSFQQIHDCLSITPTLYLHGSNDDIHWYYIGCAQRTHAPYLPGYPYRFFRVSLYLNMNISEKYSSLILDVIEKYQKL